MKRFTIEYTDARGSRIKTSPDYTAEGVASWMQEVANHPDGARRILIQSREPMPRHYVTRPGRFSPEELVLVWDFCLELHGFKVHVYVRGTETEAVDYIESEFSEDWARYHALSPEEVDMLGHLDTVIYIAPEYRR